MSLKLNKNLDQFSIESDFANEKLHFLHNHHGFFLFVKILFIFVFLFFY